MTDEKMRDYILGLIDHLEAITSKTTRHYPRNYKELRADISHWLFNADFQFEHRSDELVSVWESEKEDFLTDLRLLSPSLASKLSKALLTQKSSEFKFIDLFAGIGGFRLALEEHGGRCVFSSEWDKAAKQTYFNNYLEFPYGDINQFTNPEEISEHQLDYLIPDHDVLAAGFPCQPFSRAGVSARESLGQAHGFECETQGTLFYSIARIAYVKQPKILFLENVKNIVSHNGGETFRTIKETLENLSNGSEHKQGYKFYWKVINSKSVVPQQRIRCYMVCIRKDYWESLNKHRFIYPEFDGPSRRLKEVIRESLNEVESKKYTISDKLWLGHQKRSNRNIDRGAGFIAFEADIEKPANTIVARYGKDGKECLVPQKGKNPRYLTIRECADLFGYPKDFMFPKNRTPAYKQLGNSVVVPVVAKIAGAFLSQYGLICDSRDPKTAGIKELALTG